MDTSKKLEKRMNPEERARKLVQDAYNAPQDWVQKWLAEPAKPQRELIAYLRGMSHDVRAMCIKIPPCAIVRTRPGIKLAIPAPGKFGVVMSISDPECTFRISPHPYGDYLEGACFERHIEVIHTQPGLSPDDVRRAIEALR